MGKLAVLASLVIVLSGCVAQKPAAHVVPTAPVLTVPSGQIPQITKPITVTVFLCPPNEDTPECDAKRAQWERKKDIEALIPLLVNDFKNTSNLNKAERDRIAVLAERLVKHKYD